jgi:glycosyltransferase involved in cell wall biosynthesis
VRALIVSHHYADPGHRGKLHALAGLGVELAVAIPGGAAGLDGVIRLAPIPVRGDSARPERLRWRAGVLRRTISDFHPDLVQIEETPGSQAAAAAATAARRLKVPCIVFSEESVSRHRGPVEAWRYAAALRDAAGVIGGNRLAEGLLREDAPEARATVLPREGVNLVAPVARDGERPGFNIGFIGRLVPERGGETLIRACGQLRGPWMLTMVGTGPEQEALELIAERRGLAGRIRWMGGLPRAALEPLWQELDCLVMPAHDTPGWVARSSPALLDAMARGIAPVVTAAGALPELVGDAGIVVPDEDTLAMVLQEMVAEPARARVLGQRARQRVLEEFTDSAVAQRTVAFWEEVLGTGRGRA